MVLTIILLSCDPNVELDDISINELYSVSSFISPQDSIFLVHLYRAGEIGTIANADSFLVKNAQVIISDGSKGDTLTYNPETGRYEAKKEHVAIEPLKTYFLEIITTNGKILKASCTIPLKPQEPEVIGYKEGKDFLFTVSLSNSSDIKYFTLIPFAEGTIEYMGPRGPAIAQLDAYFIDFPMFPLDHQNSPSGFDGILPSAYEAKDPKLTIFLRNIEENLYEYLKNYQEYEEWDANNTGNLFPNFQEPLPIHSNIEGGVGIFAGYNQSVVEVNIKE